MKENIRKGALDLTKDCKVVINQMMNGTQPSILFDAEERAVLMFKCDFERKTSDLLQAKYNQDYTWYRVMHSHEVIIDNKPNSVLIERAMSMMFDRDLTTVTVDDKTLSGYDVEELDFVKSTLRRLRKEFTDNVKIRLELDTIKSVERYIEFLEDKKYHLEQEKAAAREQTRNAKQNSETAATQKNKVSLIGVLNDVETQNLYKICSQAKIFSNANKENFEKGFNDFSSGQVLKIKNQNLFFVLCKCTWGIYKEREKADAFEDSFKLKRKSTKLGDSDKWSKKQQALEEQLYHICKI